MSKKGQPATEASLHQSAEQALRLAERACYDLFDKQPDEYTQRALDQARAALKSLRRGE